MRRLVVQLIPHHQIYLVEHMLYKGEERLELISKNFGLVSHDIIYDYLDT
jgi:hypothetical protein